MSNEHKCYIGYYTKINRIIAISKHKEILINYLENHRGLNQIQYEIKKEYLTDTDLLIKYDNYIISDYNGYFIPNIDQNIIEFHTNSIDKELVCTIEQLKHIISLSMNVKKVNKDEIDQMIKTVKILIKFKNSNKILSKLNKQYQISHSILYCNIDEYLLEVRRYNDMIEMNYAYKNALYD
jgi:hypothetical protein